MQASRGLGGPGARGFASRWRVGMGVALLALAGPLSGCFAHRAGEPVVVAFQNQPSTFDPHLHNEVVAWSLLCNFYDALVGFDREMNLEPALATSWEQLDPTHLRFRLRGDVRFHDGSPLTAADVVASFERARSHPRSRIRHHLAGIVAVRAVGGDVVVETDGPAPTLLNRLAFVFVVPAAFAARDEIDVPVGTGPYRVVRRAEDGALVAEAFTGWRPRPAVRRVVFTFVEDDGARTDGLLRGDVDVAAALPEEEARRVAGREDLRVEVQQQLQVRWLQVIPSAAPASARDALSDPRVRRAMLAALDRKRLANSVFRGNATVASQYVHPVVFGYDAGLRPVRYDLGAARRLMAAAGFAGGFEVELANGPGQPGLVEGIVADLGQLGIKVTPRPMSFPELMAGVKARTLPLASFGRSCTTADAAEVFDAVFHTPDEARGLGAENYADFSDPEVDRLLDEADRTLDPSRRLGLLETAQRRMLEALPVLPLLERGALLGVSSRVTLTPRYDGWLRVADFAPGA